MKTEKTFRSGLEEALAEKLPDDFEFEPCQIPYITHRKYVPDFALGNIYIECKGFFRTGDTLKYKSIRDAIDGELIFVFSNPKKKVRKGSKMNMGEWCEKENMAYFTIDQHKELLQHIKQRKKDINNARLEEPTINIEKV